METFWSAIWTGTYKRIWKQGKKGDWPVKIREPWVLNWDLNPDSASYILYPLGNFLDLLDEKTNLIAHRVVGKNERNQKLFAK